MKKPIISLLFILATSLYLSACVNTQGQNSNSSMDPSVATTDQNVSETNYQEELREQSARAAEVDASHVHGGGHGR